MDVDTSLAVARRLIGQGSAAAAARLLEDLAAHHPSSLPLWAALGDAHVAQGEYGSALACYARVLDVEPGNLGCRQGLARCLWRRPHLALREGSATHLAETLTCADVDPQLVSSAVLLVLRTADRPLEHPLLIPLLRRAVVSDLVLEQVLVDERRSLCRSGGPEPTKLAVALAEQCRLNEFCWPVTPEESAALGTAPDWVRAMYGPDGVEPELLERARGIPVLTAVPAGNSDDVRAMYEANPYPRWTQVPGGAPMDLDEYLRMLSGGSWQPPDFLARPRILVAGCGTGRDLLQAALVWRPAELVGIDLSRTSLAYTQQMAERMGVAVELYQADLLELDGWDREFDAIVCTGVLHHLEDPLQGWRTLQRLLRPGGAMLVGLYSQTAREGIVAAQDEVRALGLPVTPDGLRAARRHILELPLDHPARDCTLLRDFYYLSGFRDMVVHVQEHRFTVDRIADALDELGLDFRAFEADASLRRLSTALFGPAMTLADWQEFERLYPHTFIGMYQFWCQNVADQRSGP